MVTEIPGVRKNRLRLKEMRRRNLPETSGDGGLLSWSSGKKKLLAVEVCVLYNYLALHLLGF